MNVKQSIFGSASEHDLFRAINSRWIDRFALYPSLPFAALIDFSDMHLKDSEYNYLFKTSVDFTLCTKSGRPLLSIEFDGLSHGFSRLGRYVQIPECQDGSRAWKLNLKTRIATDAGYPFVVVSYDEKNPIGEDTHLTIVDGIIGQMLAKRDFEQRIKHLYDQNRDEIDSADPSYRGELIQDLVIQAEVLSELEWDPIAKLEAELEVRLDERGLCGSHSVEWFHEPELPELPSDDFVDAMKQVVWVGCKATIRTPVTTVTQTVRMRNIDHAGVNPTGLTENIAMLLACKHALNIGT